jgi:hypothetical protein
MKKLFFILPFALLALYFVTLPKSLDHRKMTFGDRTVVFTVVPLNDYATRFSLENDPEKPKSVKEWRESLGANFVLNGSYFDDEEQPTGYLQDNKKTGTTAWPTPGQQGDIASYTFLVEVNETGLELSYLPKEPQTEPAGDAFLSFPTLLYNGEPLIAEDSRRYASRTILAEDKNGRDFVILTKRGEVSLFEMAQWLSIQPEEFAIAGNLDGGPSTGLSFARKNGDFDIYSADVPNVIAGYLR